MPFDHVDGFAHSIDQFFEHADVLRVRGGESHRGMNERIKLDGLRGVDLRMLEMFLG